MKVYTKLVTIMDIMLFTFLTFFSLVSLDFPCTTSAFFPERLFNHRQGSCRTFSEICTQFDAIPLSDPSINRIRPDARLQIKGHKN
jgi:hypothetical protein